MFPVQQHDDAAVHSVQQLVQRMIRPSQALVFQQVGARQHLREGKTSPQGHVQAGEGAVSRVHGTDDVDILRHRERFPRIRQAYADAIPLMRAARQTAAVRFFHQRDELAEDARDIAAVDLVDDEHIGQRILLFRTLHLQQAGKALPVENSVCETVEDKLAERLVQQLFYRTRRRKGA